MDHKKMLLESYGIKTKEADTKQNKRTRNAEPKKRPGRKKAEASLGRDSHQVTIRLYGSNYEYCMAKAKKEHITFGALSSIINILIDEDRTRNSR